MKEKPERKGQRPRCEESLVMRGEEEKVEAEQEGSVTNGKSKS